MHQNGITYQRSQITVGQIRDGLSKTYCIGEKYLNSDHYENGLSPADDQTTYVGHDRDVNGYAGNNDKDVPPVRDRPGLTLNWSFGGAHPSTWNVVLCDGSVTGLEFEMDLQVHRAFGGRNDGR